jgi:hypothetical protein
MIRKLASFSLAIFACLYLTGATWLPLFQKASGGGGGVLSLDGTAQNGLATGALTIANGTAFSNATNASIIVAAISYEYTSGTPAAVSGVSGGGLTWASIAISPANGVFTRTELWWAYAATHLTSQTITATIANTNGNFDDATIVVFAVTGFLGTAYQTAPWDVNASLPKTNSGVNNAPTETGISTTSANSMVINVVGSNDNVAITAPSGLSVGTNMSIVNTGGTNNSSTYVATEVLSSTLSSVTQTWTGNQAGWAGIVHALKAGP